MGINKRQDKNDANEEYILPEQTKTWAEIVKGTDLQKNLKTINLLERQPFDLLYLPLLFFTVKIFFHNFGMINPNLAGILSITLGALFCTIRKTNSIPKLMGMWAAGLLYLLFLMYNIKPVATGIPFIGRFQVAAISSGASTLIFALERNTNEQWLYKIKKQTLNYLLWKDLEGGGATKKELAMTQKFIKELEQQMLGNDTWEIDKN